MARQKQRPVLANDRVTTEIFVPVPLPVIHVTSIPVQDTQLNMLGYWMTSAGTSAIPTEVIPYPYLFSGTVVQENANYAWWVYSGAVIDMTGRDILVIECTSDFILEEYDGDNEIEEMWQFS